MFSGVRCGALPVLEQDQVSLLHVVQLQTSSYTTCEEHAR
jgi:hypothetical protein